MDIRRVENQPSVGTNLIIHHRFTDIFHQIVELLCVICVVQKLRYVFLSCHLIQSSTDTFQFPNNSRPSASTLDHGEDSLTVPGPSSLFLP